MITEKIDQLFQNFRRITNVDAQILSIMSDVENETFEKTPQEIFYIYKRYSDQINEQVARVQKSMPSDRRKRKRLRRWLWEYKLNGKDISTKSPYAKFVVAHMTILKKLQVPMASRTRLYQIHTNSFHGALSSHSSK